MAAGWSITRPRLFDLLSQSNSVLLAGCGGGYDFLSSLPLYAALTQQGKKVAFANLSFTSLRSTGAPEYCSDCYAVSSSLDSKLIEGRYFPELYLARWLRDKERKEITIYAFDREIGAKNLSKAYQKLASTLKLDAIVLVDGGTDSLMFGTEERMGTPSEDHCSMIAVDSVNDVPVKLLVCIGFGVDTYHGVSHGLFLENVACVEKDGGFYGCFSISRHSTEGQLYEEGYKAVSAHMQPSIVCASITDAMNGHFGNYHSTKRTGKSELFINSLMTLYWTFELRAVVARISYASELLETESMTQVDRVIEKYHSQARKSGSIRTKLPLPM